MLILWIVVPDASPPAAHISGSMLVCEQKSFLGKWTAQVRVIKGIWVLKVGFKVFMASEF